MKTIEDIVAATVEKAVRRATDELRAAVISAVRAEIRSASPPSTPQEERLITIKDAASRLLVSVAKINALADSGAIREFTTPNGRRKIVESSINEYIQKAGAN